MKKAIMATLLLIPIAGCSNSGPSLTSREKFVCSQCHNPPLPDQHSAAEWPSVIARMVAHMQTNNKTIPSVKEQEEIIKFYQAKAGR